MNYALIFTVVVLVVEIILSATWNNLYFSKGIKVFLYRFQVINAINGRPSPEKLNKQFSRGWLASFVFKSITPTEIAFREKMLELRLFHYTPVMHGLIYVEPERREVTVVGFLNWWIIFFALIPFDINQKFLDIDYIFSLGFLGVFGLIYFIQRIRYRKIGDVIKEELKLGV